MKKFGISRCPLLQASDRRLVRNQPCQLPNSLWHQKRVASNLVFLLGRPKKSWTFFFSGDVFRRQVTGHIFVQALLVQLPPAVRPVAGGESLSRVDEELFEARRRSLVGWSL